MNENEFWNFLKEKREKGTARIAAGSLGFEKRLDRGLGEYMVGHALLPEDYDKLSQGTVMAIGKLLFRDEVKTRTKEAVLILLAHQTTKDAVFILEEYNKRPDRGLEIFSELALQECLWWNEDDI